MCSVKDVNQILCWQGIIRLSTILYLQWYLSVSSSRCWIIQFPYGSNYSNICSKNVLANSQKEQQLHNSNNPKTNPCRAMTRDKRWNKVAMYFYKFWLLPIFMVLSCVVLEGFGVTILHELLYIKITFFILIL